jgi:hypothetical protein
MIRYIALTWRSSHDPMGMVASGLVPEPGSHHSLVHPKGRNVIERLLSCSLHPDTD